MKRSDSYRLELIQICLPVYFNRNKLCHIAPKHSDIFWFSNPSGLSVPDEDYSRSVVCALNWISTLLFIHCDSLCLLLVFGVV
jgi:hypothetical protein